VHAVVLNWLGSMEDEEKIWTHLIVQMSQSEILAQLYIRCVLQPLPPSARQLPGPKHDPEIIDRFNNTGAIHTLSLPHTVANQSMDGS